MRCPKCGSMLPDGALFCSECGSKIQDERKNICPFCNSAINEGDTFCWNCGQPLQKQPEVTEMPESPVFEGPTEPDTEKKKEMPKIIALAAGIVILAALAILLLVNLVGDSKVKTSSKENKEAASSADSQSTTKDSSTADESETDSKSEVELNEDDFKYTEYTSFETAYYTFKLPDYWDDLTTWDGMGSDITFFQDRSTDAGFDGDIFTITKVDSDEVDDYENYDLLAEEGDMSYLLIYPDEKTYDIDDEYTKLEYQRLQKDKAQIKKSFKVTAVTEEKTAQSTENSDYIIPDSNSRYLTRADLTSLSAEELRLARNEIYARRGRRFKDASLQSYFDSKSWYHGAIAPDNFTDSMLSDCEKKNAELIRAYEKEIGVNQ